MVFTANSQTPPIFAAKFGWTEDQTKFNNSLINTSAVVGIALGSFLGGKTITYGRRKATLITQTIGLLGGCLTQVLSVPAICIGRCLYGIAAGHANIIMSKSIVETIPGELSGQFGIMTNGFIGIGQMLMFFLGSVLPQEEAAYKGDENWRIIFAAPIIIASAQLILFIFVFREEPIDFSIGTDRPNEAIKLMKKVYTRPHGLANEDFDTIL